MDIKEKIKRLAKKYEDRIIRVRREIHRNPELSFQEFETSRLVYKYLSGLKLNKLKIIGETGVVGLISNLTPRPSPKERGEHAPRPSPKGRGKCVALRADLDALPINERTNLSFASKNNGKMHACGHDVHTSMLLGAAMILSEIRDELNGIVKLIFQPGEEKNPGGASVLIKEGVLDNPKVSAIFGQHIMPNKRAGNFGFCRGVMMASQDELYITIKGKGGHGAKPHETIDPVVIASEVVLALQTIVSRNTNPYEPIVVTIGKIEGGTATNIIPGEVKLSGTIRTLNEGLRKKSLKLIERTIKGICSSAGASYEFRISPGYPELTNDGKLTEFAEKAAAEFAGKQNIFKAERFMGAEDFAYYLKKVPGTFYRTGTGTSTDLHTPFLKIDESTLAKGAGFMAYLAYRYLSW